MVESVIKCLQKDYDILYTPKEVLGKVSAELISNLEYTTFMKSPISNKDVEYNMMEQSTKGKAACDIYLPALANSLDIHIRVIQKIGSFFAVLHTNPTQTRGQKKTVNLPYDEEKYSPVVYMKIDDKVGIVSPQQQTQQPTTSTSTQNKSQGIEIVGYTPGDVIIISDTENEEIMEENAPQQESVQVIPSSNPHADGDTKNEIPEPQSPDQIIALDGTNDLPTIPSPSFNPKKREPFHMTPFIGMLPEVVNKIPCDANGLKYYLIEVGEGEYFCDKYKDGRYFVMNTTRRKGFCGVRHKGKCQGNFQCMNDGCAFYLEEKKRNKCHFKTIGQEKFCFTCKTLAARIPCGAEKMIEYNMERRLLSIYIKGNHTCQVRVNTAQNDDYMKKTLTELGGRVTPKELAQIQMMKELEKQIDSGVTDMSAIVDIAAKLTNKQRISEIKWRIQTQLEK